MFIYMFVLTNKCSLNPLNPIHKGVKCIAGVMSLLNGSLVVIFI